MINFDSSHQRTNESIKPNGKKLKNILVAGVLVSSMLLFTGCDKSPKSEADVSRIQQFVSEHVNPKCEISELHVHKLVSERGAITYGAREPDFYDRLKGNTFRFTMGGTESYERTNEYLIVSEEEYKLYEKLLRSGLISIKDNEVIFRNILNYFLSLTLL